MSSQSVATADLTKLSQMLARASEEADTTVEKVMDAIAHEISERMRQLAPRRTGRLAGSIQVTKTANRWAIGPVGVNYAIYQEFGTASRGEFGGTPYKIKPKSVNGTLHFKIDGKWISTKEVIHPGIPAHPYIRPAASQVTSEIGNRVGVAVGLMMRGKK